MADAVLRATGGYAAEFLIPAAMGDSTDAGQLGINAPVYQALSIAPVSFRRTRPVMQEQEAARYELLVSATAIAQQVSLLDLQSADALFSMVASVQVAGMTLLVEGWNCTVLVGEALIYRLLLRVEMPLAAVAQSQEA